MSDRTNKTNRVNRTNKIKIKLLAINNIKFF